MLMLKNLLLNVSKIHKYSLLSYRGKLIIVHLIKLSMRAPGNKYWKKRLNVNDYFDLIFIIGIKKLLDY
jgi:hypothetical protein